MLSLTVEQQATKHNTNLESVKIVALAINALFYEKKLFTTIVYVFSAQYFFPDLIFGDLFPIEHHCPELTLWGDDCQYRGRVSNLFLRVTAANAINCFQ